MLRNIAFRVMIHTLNEITEIIHCVKHGVGFLLRLGVGNPLDSILIDEEHGGHLLSHFHQAHGLQLRCMLSFSSTPISL